MSGRAASSARGAATENSTRRNQLRATRADSKLGGASLGADRWNEAEETSATTCDVSHHTRRRVRTE